MAIAVRRILAADASTLGDVKDSILTEAQFILENGTGWVLADGRSIVGSKLHQKYGITTATDIRGLFRRAANNGRTGTYADPGGNRAVGNIQGHAFQTHNHTQDAHNHAQDSHSHYLPGTNWLQFNVSGGGVMHDGGAPPKNFVSNPYTNSAQPYIYPATPAIQNKSATGAASEPTAAETRPVNIAVNVFLKIN